jgi:ABC-type glycerol-3-phosphate transport system substrate-binding protein
LYKQPVVIALGLAVILGSVAPAALRPPARAQAAGSATITLAVPVAIKDAINDKVISEFEAANPGVIVQVITGDTTRSVSPANDINSHLDTIQKLTSEADVVLIGNDGLVTPEATRAGYFLNMQPLIDGDPQLNAADFIPQLFKAYQWDQGTWALPLAADATVLTYDPAAFDKANLNYPTGQWSLDELTNAVKTLSVIDDKGVVTTPAIELYAGNNDIPLYMSVIGKPLFDTGAIPNPPQIDSPETRVVFEKLRDLLKYVPLQVANFGTAPIRIESILNLAFQTPNSPIRKGSLLPGGHSYLSVSAVAVSAATQNADKAYALARFLTTRPEINRFTVLPARVSLQGQTDPTNNFNIKLTPEVQKLLDEAVANGYTAADARFYDYVSVSALKLKTQNLDAAAAIADAQQTALTALQTAVIRKTDAGKVAVVATPVPTPDLNKGITLKFGVTVFATSLPKKAEIQALADQFVKQNPGVAHIDIQNGFDGITTATDKYDCFYLPYSSVPSAQLDAILNLDPYITSDKSYDGADYLGGALTQVQRDNKTWALPVGLSPTVMWYDPLVFANAGAQKPTFGWGIDKFKDAVTTLKPFVKEGQSPFTMAGTGGEGASLLMLIGAYGGTPIDWSTTPPTVKFTDATNAAAIRQVLDLAKAGLIDYKSLGASFGIGAGSAQNAPFYSQQLSGLNFSPFGGAAAASQDTSKYTAVTFPKGSQNQALSYSEGTLYISAKAQNPDACYKWISTFAQHPELMSLMPVRHAQLADTGLDTAVGKALASVYRDVGQVLDAPGTLKIPSLFDGGSNISGFIVQYWLFQAWDDYVLKDKDLDTGLQTAQQYASGYTECAAALPAYDPKQQKYNDYLRTVLTCATKVDPRLKGLLGG